MDNRRFVQRAGLALIVITLPLDSTAQTELEETVIVASRVPTPLSQVGVSVDVIDREALTLLGYRDLTSLLNIQTGISVTRDGGSARPPQTVFGVKRGTGPGWCSRAAV